MKRKRPGYIDLTDNILNQLKAERKRTKVGPVNILKIAKGEKPKTLSYVTISKWFKGNAKTAYKKHLDYVLEAYKSLPTINEELLTKEIAANFRKQIRATKLPLQKLLQYQKDVPPSLNAKEFYTRISGKIAKTYNKDHGDYILKICDAYAAMRKEREVVKDYQYRQDLKEIPEQDLEQLRRYRDLLNLLPGHIFKVCQAPEGLTHAMVQAWLGGQTKSAKPEYVKWVLNSCNTILKKAIEK